MESSISAIKHLDEPLSFSRYRMASVDDTLIEKYGKHIEAVGKLYDHSKGCFLQYAQKFTTPSLCRS